MKLATEIPSSKEWIESKKEILKKMKVEADDRREKEFQKFKLFLIDLLKKETGPVVRFTYDFIIEHDSLLRNRIRSVLSEKGFHLSRDTSSFMQSIELDKERKFLFVLEPIL